MRRPCVHQAPDERHVFLLDLAIVELPRQLAVRRVVLGDDHDAGRAAVEPVDDAGPQFAADAAQVVDVVQQRVDQRAVRVARRRVHHHAGRLVDDDDVGVLEEDVERQRLRAAGVAGAGVGNVDRRSRRRRGRRSSPSPRGRPPDAAVLDEALDLRPRLPAAAAPTRNWSSRCPPARRSTAQLVMVHGRRRRVSGRASSRAARRRRARPAPARLGPLPRQHEQHHERQRHQHHRDALRRREAHRGPARVAAEELDRRTARSP